MGQNAGYFALIVAGLVTNATTLAKPLNPDGRFHPWAISTRRWPARYSSRSKLGRWR
ncbi:hypothetical protein NKH74_28860 [Mesorhizobium sp. M0933]|uniref:hypothetical protein n=1 Tax=Mesorhizobium sp. M0933 TaxID=2957030 RepID=UPI0033384575